MDFYRNLCLMNRGSTTLKNNADKSLYISETTTVWSSLIKAAPKF